MSLLTQPIRLIFRPYRRLHRAYREMLETDEPRARWRFEFLPIALISILATFLFVAGLSLFWAIGLWALYLPLWVMVNFGGR